MTRHLLGLILWSVITFAVLSLSALPGEWEHGLCGTWG
jgi:hypothetical protein